MSTTTDSVIVVGMGEVGAPLFRILSRTYQCVGVDMDPVASPDSCSVLHICYPFQIRDFVGTTVRYIEKYRPQLTIINSTVAPGTTRNVVQASGTRVVFSPVRGKHVKMEQDMLHYRKFVGAEDPQIAEQAQAHFAAAGFHTAIFPSTEIAELAKLIETTWLGVLIGFAQEAERMAKTYGGTYDDLRAYIREVDFLPHDIFPGLIGGHCVMSNIKILKGQFRSEFLDAVDNSNAKKALQTESVVLQRG